jgi:hypothetical protein
MHRRVLGHFSRGTQRTLGRVPFCGDNPVRPDEERFPHSVMIGSLSLITLKTSLFRSQLLDIAQHRRT